MYDCIVIPNTALAACAVTSYRRAPVTPAMTASTGDKNHVIIVDDARTVVLVQTCHRRHGSAASHTQLPTGHMD